MATLRASGARSFEAALAALQALQSNQSTISAITTGGLAAMNAQSLPGMRAYLEHLGLRAAELNALNVIHITGTKGKGSTSAFTERLLRAEGFRTGLYTSPHLLSVCERIQLQGRPIDRDLFARYTFEVLDRLASSDQPPPNYFRFLTLLSLYAFHQEKVDVGILEVGIGGLYDPTNVVEAPVACGIASIGLDHMNLLGNTVELIAAEKAGIMKRGAPCFSVPQRPSVEDVLRRAAAERGASRLTFVEPLKPGVELGIPGAHQYGNAALALALAGEWIQRQHGRASDSARSSTALRETRWPARCQTLTLPSTGQRYFVDGAHTEESINACVDWFVGTRPSATRRPVVLLFTCVNDREPAKLLAPIARSAEACHLARVLFCPPVAKTTDSANHNSQEQMRSVWSSLSSSVPSDVIGDLSVALSTVRKEHPEADVLVTGSLLLCGVFLQLLRDQEGIDPWA